MHRVEQVLVDRLVVQRCWKGLDVFDESHPLRRDAVEVRPGLEAMDAGDWARAASLLRGVPRRSPFAAWRLFCKAMVCFGAGDEDGLRRTLELLPADFALPRKVAECRRLIARGGGGDGRDQASPEPVGERGSATALAGELKRALQNGNARAVGTLIERLADALYPEEPGQARIDLLQIVGLAAARDLFPVAAFEALARRLLPAERMSGVLARIFLQGQQVSPELWNPTPAAILLDALPGEFPRAEDQALARACVLEALARTGRAAVLPEFLPPDQDARAGQGAGPPHRGPGAGLRRADDGESRGRSRQPRGLPLSARSAARETAGKRRLQRVLEDMAHRFPDDPTPWLELVGLQHSRNAYRQAESALAEARRRAPHDDRLLDLQAVDFVKSADQSRNKGRFAVATRDLQRAADLGREAVGLVLPSKWLVLEIVTTGTDAAATAARRLQGLPPGEQLRTLVLVLRDLHRNSHVRNVRPDMLDAVWRLLADRVSLAGECAPDEIVRLLEPLPVELGILYDDRLVATSLAGWWPELLERVDEERLPTVLDILLECSGWDQVRAEIERRLRGVRKPRRDPLLLFYLAVVRYEEGSDHDSRRFRDVLQGADIATRERLRTAAARLACHTQDPLRRALLTFDFEALDAPPDALGPELPPLDELLASIEEYLEADGLPRGPDGSPRRAPPDPGDPSLIERFRLALTEGPADRARDARQGMLFDRRIYDDLDHLDELIDDSGLRGDAILPSCVGLDDAGRSSGATASCRPPGPRCSSPCSRISRRWKSRSIRGRIRTP